MRISPKIDVKLLRNRVNVLRSTSKTLRELSRAPAPKGLNSKQQKELTKYNKWLEASSGALNELAKLGDALLTKGTELIQATQEMQEMNQSFNLQYLGLQRKMQQENRQFTMLSNIMKVRHDSARSAINNIR